MAEGEGEEMTQRTMTMTRTKITTTTQQSKSAQERKRLTKMVMIDSCNSRLDAILGLLIIPAIFVRF